MPPVPVAQSQEFNVNTVFSGLLSEGTKRTYAGDFKYFLSFLGLPPFLAKSREQIDALAGVTRETAAKFRDYMLNTEQLSASTVCRRLTVVTAVYEALREEGVILKNPFARVRRPRVGSVGKTPAFSKEQAERILSMPNRSTALGRRDRILLLLMFFCGLRRSEVAKVARDDFYESQGHVLLRVHSKGKSDKADSVMIPPAIWPEIQAYLKNV
jgi:integrase/recombinase XerD